MADIKYEFSDLMSTDQSKSIKVIKLEGQMDESNVDDLAPKVYEVIEGAPAGTSFIIDLELLSYMNSKSIGYMSDWYGKITGKGGKMSIAKAATNIKDVLNVVGLDQVIPLAQTMEEAKTLV